MNAMCTNVRFSLAMLLVLFGCAKAPEKPAAAPQYSPLATFPPLGDARPVDDGVVVHRVALAHGSEEGRIWIYLPEKLPSKSMPAVFIAPAGAPPFVGNGFGIDLDAQQHPEHLPYVRAGFAVVAYDTDGELANREDPTFEQVQRATVAFKDAQAGVLNARRAIDYVLKMVPAVDPARLYTAGHSSAGRIALLVAENDPRIAAAVAYAPVTDVEKRVQEIAPEAGDYLEANVTGFREFLQQTSPLRQAGNLRCPVFLFHSQHDSLIPITRTEAFAESLKKTNPRVTFVKATRGDHYDSMIEEGLSQGIEWLRALSTNGV